MGEHDATSVVGQMGELDAARAARPERVTPEQLVGRFCGARERVNNVETSSGHCGYVGGRGDGMVVGFDDGYDFMGFPTDRGWGPLPAKGDWPYVVYLAYRAREPYAIVEYCEGDLAVWVFESGAAAQAFYKSLTDAP